MKQPSITSLPPSPDDERRGRVIKYSITMGIRVLCLGALPFVHGGWMFVFAAGAIFLPYVAVILANVGSTPGVGQHDRPTGVVVDPRTMSQSQSQSPADAGAKSDQTDQDQTR
ncbi:DUF3099 domain-containing protein [Plantibacter sp. Mn2098]|uniref:DUF3099 domain-containing protein n=1 Tax=Plantibacter sp. Mn2098 TaxID=3395266 RepID=UPI003BD2F08D